MPVLLLSCATGGEVARRRGDALEHGRRIDPLAYAWYVRGAHHERRGEFSQAAHDYRAALSHDRASGRAWAALGRVLCQTNTKEAERTFERGLRKADRLAPIYTEMGRCRLSQAGATGRPLHQACENLAKAMSLEPHSRKVSQEYATCLRRAGRVQEAARQERAQRLFFRTTEGHAVEPTLGSVDQALLAGDLEEAQNQALELMSPGTLSARAALLGQTALARTQADLVLRASPSDADANVTLVALGDDLGPSIETLQDLSPPGLLLLFRIIKRTGHEKVALHFLDETREQLLRSDDPLITQELNALERMSSPR